LNRVTRYVKCDRGADSLAYSAPLARLIFGALTPIDKLVDAAHEWMPALVDARARARIPRRATPDPPAQSAFERVRPQ